MKKLLSIILAVCVISTLLVMPVSAASIFDGYLDLDASNIIYHQVATTATPVGEVTTISEYPISNLIDGDPTTTAAISFWGQSQKRGGSTQANVADVFLTADLVIDLGAQYDITALSFIPPTADQATAINAAYPSGVKLVAGESWWVGATQFFTENPVTNPSATAVNGTMQTSKVNNGVTVPDGEFRYIKFTGRYYNQGPGFMNELKVKVAAKDDGTKKYADFYQVETDVADPTYPMSNLFDGDKTTPALLALRASLTATGCNYSIRAVDLGVAKRLSAIKLTAPSNYVDLLEAIGITRHNGNYCEIVAYENEPKLTLGKAPSSYPSLTQDPSGVKLYSGALSTREIAITTDMPIRYLTFTTTMAGYPGVLNEIEFVEYVAHEHNWAEVWSSDDANHWKECTAEGCDVAENSAKEGYGAHVYDDKYDAYCNTCNHFRVAEPVPQPVEATFASSVAFGDANGVEALRFYFTPSFTDAITDFGAYIVPFDLRGEDGETAIVKGGKAIDSGKTFAADLVGIPEDFFNETIVGIPFVVSADGLYTFGDAVETTVNSLK